MEIYNGQCDQDAEYRVIKNSETISENAFYYFDETGANEVDAVADDAYALAVGFVDKHTTALGSGFETKTGTLTQARTGNTYAAAADNVTVDGIRVHGRLVKAGDVFTAELSNTINTTTGSGKPGYFIGVKTSAATTLDEATATSTKSGNTAFTLVDNGQGENSAQNPERRGNWVLFTVNAIQA